MKRYSVSEARMRMAEMLDCAEGGESVAIERKGTRFQIVATKVTPLRKRTPALEILDDGVEKGQWTWQDRPDGLTYSRRKIP
jgi:antitoxin (DNA-binding transcriptional repressor) of toxin-antitoxin stability system